MSRLILYLIPVFLGTIFAILFTPCPGVYIVQGTLLQLIGFWLGYKCRKGGE